MAGRHPAERPGHRFPVAPGPLENRELGSFPNRERFKSHLLVVLPGPREEAVSTNELGDRFQLDLYQRSSLLWSSLDHLARLGLAERIVRPGKQVRYWRRTPAGDEHIRDTVDPT